MCNKRRDEEPARPFIPTGSSAPAAAPSFAESKKEATMSNLPIGREPEQDARDAAERGGEDDGQQDHPVDVKAHEARGSRVFRHRAQGGWP